MATMMPLALLAVAIVAARAAVAADMALQAAAAGSTLDIRDCGAVAGSLAHNLSNAAAISHCLANATSGDTVLVPAGLTFYTVGGIHAAQAQGWTLRIEGTLAAVSDFARWPVDSTGKKYLDVLHLSGCQNVQIIGNGTIDGSGKPWWNRWVVGDTGGMHRPHLVVIDTCVDVLVHGITMLNSPNYHLLLSNVARVEVGFVRVEVDRKAIRAAKARKRQLRMLSGAASASGGPGSVAGPGGKPVLQPEDLNTDGIDPSGRDVWIHDSYINNDDDSIAVKPCTRSKCSNAAADGCSALGCKGGCRFLTI